MKGICFRVFWDLLNLKTELRAGWCVWELWLRRESYMCIWILNKQTNKNKFSSYLQRNSTTFFRVAQSVHSEVEKYVTENADWNFQGNEIQLWEACLKPYCICRWVSGGCLSWCSWWHCKPSERKTGPCGKSMFSLAYQNEFFCSGI